jgi:hypothetical protein
MTSDPSFADPSMWPVPTAHAPSELPTPALLTSSRPWLYYLYIRKLIWSV